MAIFSKHNTLLVNIVCIAMAKMCTKIYTLDQTIRHDMLETLVTYLSNCKRYFTKTGPCNVQIFFQLQMFYMFLIFTQNIDCG